MTKLVKAKVRAKGKDGSDGFATAPVRKACLSGKLLLKVFEIIKSGR
jgi:hypothetical protein